MKISVIIPVLNEEKIINAAVGSLRRQAGGCGTEVIVVDGSPSMGTIKVLRTGHARKIPSETGRAAQMNRGASAAGGDVLLFLHADTGLPENAFALIETALKDTGCGAGAFSLGIDSGKPGLRLIAFMANLRNRFTGVPYGDQAVFISKKLFDRLGGYREIPLMEDVDLMKRIKKMNERIVILKQKAVTSPRRWQENGVVRTTLRNHLVRFLYALGVPPEKLALIYEG